MLGNYLIGLREGLEAALVVSVLLAYLVRTGRSDRVPHVWTGVGIAVGLSLALGAVLTYTRTSLLRSEEAQEVFAGVLSLVTVALVTWMIFWMRRAARSIGRELEGRLDAAIAVGSVAVVTMAFVAVAREGLETALLAFSAIQAAGSTAGPLLGFALGILTAVALGWLLYRRAVRVNLATFFRVTGVLLIVVAAGLLAYGVHELQEGGVLPEFEAVAFDVSGAIPLDSWYGALLAGALSFRPRTTWLEVVVWLAYLVPCLYLFLRRPAPRAVVVAEAA